MTRAFGAPAGPREGPSPPGELPVTAHRLRAGLLADRGHQHGGRMPTARPLPDSPDLDQLKRQAKDLLRAARDADPAALSRFRVLPSLQHASDDDLTRG